MNINKHVQVKANTPVIIIFTTAFFLFGLAGILHHEMWLDEMHHWLIARESNSISDLFFNIRQEGHPPLWNLILYGITKLTSDWFYMQLVHITIATVAMFIFLYFATFSWVFKTGIFFSYFFFYEYNIISRNYAPGILLLWLICVLISQKNRSFIFISFLSGVLANCHLFYLFISVGIFCVLFCTSYNTKEKKEIVAGFLIYFLLLVMATTFIIPQDLLRYNGESFFSFKSPVRGLGIFMKAFFSIPDLTKTNCWNSSILIDKFPRISILPALLSFFIPYIIFARNRACLFLFYFSAGCISAFLYLSPYNVGIRYYGSIYIVFIMTMWFQKIFKDEYIVDYSIRFSFFIDKLNLYLGRPFIVVLFLVQIISSLLMFCRDISQPFSQAKNTAEYLIDSGFVNKKLAVTNVGVVSSIQGFLPCYVFSPEANTYLKYSDWTLNPFQFSEPRLIESMKGLLRQNNQEWALVSNHQLIFNSDKLNPRLNYSDKEINVSLIKSFTGSLVSSENYFVYKIQKR